MNPYHIYMNTKPYYAAYLQVYYCIKVFRLVLPNSPAALATADDGGRYEILPVGNLRNSSSKEDVCDANR